MKRLAIVINMCAVCAFLYLSHVLTEQLAKT